MPSKWAIIGDNEHDIKLSHRDLVAHNGIDVTDVMVMTMSHFMLKPDILKYAFRTNDYEGFMLSQLPEGVLSQGITLWRVVPMEFVTPFVQRHAFKLNKFYSEALPLP